MATQDLEPEDQYIIVFRGTPELFPNRGDGLDTAKAYAVQMIEDEGWESATYMIVPRDSVETLSLTAINVGIVIETTKQTLNRYKLAD